MSDLKQQLKSLIIEQYNCQWGEDILDDLVITFREEIKEAFNSGRLYQVFKDEDLEDYLKTKGL